MMRIKIYLFVSILSLLHYTSFGKTFFPKPDSYFDSLEKIISTGDSTLLLTEFITRISEAVMEGDSTTCAKTSYLLGKFNIVRSLNYPKAYNYFLRALSIFENDSDSRNIGKCEMQIGLIYFLQRNFDEALNYFTSAYSNMITTNDSLKIARLAYLLGLTYSEKKDFKNAITNLNKAGYYAKYISDNDVKREYLYGMGIYYYHFGNGDSALKYLLPVYQYYVDKKFTPGAQTYGADVARAYWLKHDVEKTKQFASSVISSGKNVFPFLISYHLLYEIALRQNDFKKAVTYLDKFIALKDSILNEKNLFDLASLKTKFILDKERHERAFAQAKIDAEHEATLDNQKRQKNIFIGSFIFSVIFLGLLYYAYVLKKKKNQQLAHTIEKLKSTQEQLVQHEKLASLGRLSAGIAHELRNPLNFINNFSEVSGELILEMQQLLDDDRYTNKINELKNNVSKINEHGKKAESIIKQFNDHISSSPKEREATDINQLCDSFIKIADQSRTVNKSNFNYTLIRKYGQNLPGVFVSSHEIGRVIVNIFTNSLQALEDKMNQENFKPEIIIQTYKKDDKILIKISDNGGGIAKENLSKILDPFFTTRPPNKGVGLGLSVAHDIIRSYGGNINFDSVWGAKTCVTIELPYSLLNKG